MGRIKLLERANSSPGLEVDRTNHVIKGVKILGLESVNRRRYTPEACQAAIPLYEGIPVNADHPERDPKQPRSIRDRIGDLINVRFVEGKGLYGDLRYNPAKPIAKELVYWAKKLPHCVGLSHNATGQGDDDAQGVFVVEEITEVRSVDLVADPATTRSLSEGRNMPAAKSKTSKNKPFEADDLLEGESDTMAESGKTDLKTSILTILSGEGDDSEKADKIAELMGQMEDTQEADEEKEMEEADDEPDGDEVEDDEEEDEAPHAKKNMKEHREILSLKAKVKELTESSKRDRKEAKIRRICESKGVKLDKATFQICMSLGTKELIEHQINLTAKAQKAGAPRSGSFALVEGINGGDERPSRLPKDRTAQADWFKS